MRGDTRFRADCCCCCGHGVPVELLKRYAKEIPKVELHVHIEGTVCDRLARQIVRENGILHHPLFQESTSSSECSSYHGYTCSCTEVSSNSSETESLTRKLSEVEPSAAAQAAHEDTVAAADQRLLRYENELVASMRSTVAHCKSGSSSNSSPQAIEGEHSRLHGLPVLDGGKTICTLPSDQDLRNERTPVAPPRRPAPGSKGGLSERREAKTSTGKLLSQKDDRSNGRSSASQKGSNTVACGKELWRRNPESSSKWGSVTRNVTYSRNRKLHIYPNLDVFLLDYMDRADIMRKAEDYYKVLLAYLESAAADNVKHVEFHFAHDPNTHIPWRAQLHELYRGCCEAQRRWGMTTRRIFGFLRCLPVEEHLKCLDEAQDVLHMIDAVGLVASEKGNENRKFKEAFDLAKRRGLHCVAHAGEEGPASNVRDAITYNYAERIDHGLAAVEDEELLLSLIRNKVPLTVCPLSNVCLGACRSVEEHPLLKCRPQCGLRRMEKGEEEDERKGEGKKKMEEEKQDQNQKQKTQVEGQNTSTRDPTFAGCIITGSRISRQYPGLIDKGLKVTISSDDPAFFGGGVYNNYRAIIETNSWSEQQQPAAAQRRRRTTDAKVDRGEDASLAARRKEAGEEGAAGESNIPRTTGEVIRGETAAAEEPRFTSGGSINGEAADVWEVKNLRDSLSERDTACPSSLVTSAARVSDICAPRGFVGTTRCSSEAIRYKRDMQGTHANKSAPLSSPVATTVGQNGSDSNNDSYSDVFMFPLMRESLHWRLDTVKQVAVNGVEASFLTEVEKQRFLKNIEAFDRRFRRKYSIGPQLVKGNRVHAAAPTSSRRGSRRE